MRIKPIAAALVALQLSGCATHREFREIDAQTSATRDHVQSVLDETNRQMSGSALTVSDSTWINPEPVRATNEKKQVPVCWLQVNRTDSLSVDDVAALIADSCHVNVRVLPDARVSHVATAGLTRAVQGELPLPGSTSAADSRGRTPLGNTGSSGPTTSVSTGGTLSGLRWDGSLSGLLDDVTARMGISWRWRNNQIQLFRLDTRTFQLAILNADTSMNAKVVGGTTSSSGSSGTSGSSSLSGEQSTSQQTNVAVSSKVYDDIKATVSAMLSSEGSSWLAPGSATLTVTDTPEVLNRIGEYIDRQNAILDRQVKLKVDVYRITFRDTKQIGIDWTAVYSAAKGMGYTLTSAFGDAASDVATIGVTSSSGRLSGSEVLIKALNQQANISSATTTNTVTTNMVPAPLQIAKETTYLAKTSTTTSDSYSSTELEPDTITTGLFMTVLPYIRDNGTIQLQMSFSLSDDPTITTVSAKDGSTSIQTPTTDVRSLTQRANLKPGQTLVLNGFQSLYNEANRQGTTSKSWFGFGGGESAERDRSMLLVLVTPVLSS
ncbi:PilN family type IVB pilus formation outer membrane protein [Escherichia coli]|uniref:PilN family type IVB pilus formation outer membrane protein n=1 Tax=Escherichia coli TaxID=562 RepID=UPI0026DF94EB|nr:PilN family type IVB pilus formation outer membrane protein [Escherichia coli]